MCVCGGGEDTDIFVDHQSLVTTTPTHTNQLSHHIISSPLHTRSRTFLTHTHTHVIHTTHALHLPLTSTSTHTHTPPYTHTHTHTHPSYPFCLLPHYHYGELMLVVNQMLVPNKQLQSILPDLEHTNLTPAWRKPRNVQVLNRRRQLRPPKPQIPHHIFPGYMVDCI